MKSLLEIAKAIVTRDEFQVHCCWCRQDGIGLKPIVHKSDCLIMDAIAAIAAEETRLNTPFDEDPPETDGEEFGCCADHD
jgi:hypothetical protein